MNKGEAHHALKRAINFHQRGELRDRTEEGQHYRLAGLNLLAAIIIYWNTRKLGEAVFTRKNADLDVPAEFLAHVSPLRWEHINDRFKVLIRVNCNFDFVMYLGDKTARERAVVFTIAGLQPVFKLHATC